MKKPDKMIVLRYILIVSFLTISGLKLLAQKEVVIDKIIAKVDNYIILKSDLEQAYLEYLSRGEFGGTNARCRILETLIINKMLVAKSEIDSVYVEDGEVEAQLGRRMSYIISQVGGSEEDLEQFYGKSMEQIQLELFEETKEQMIIQKMQGEITTDLKVTPAEVKKFFNAIPKDSLPFFSTEVVAAQIVIRPEAGKKQLDKYLQLAHEIRGRIIKGESFAELAKLYSEDPGSAARGGQLPFYRRGELAPEFEATAMTLQPGELSMPVKTQFGYHLIELQEKRGNTFKSRHILVTPKPSQDDIAQAERKLDSIRTLVVEGKMTFRAAAKEFSDDKLTSQMGGFFTDEDGDTRISVELLDPNVFFTLDTMKVGTITKPIKFTDYDGTTAFRIIHYVSRVRPHQANLKDDYQKIANAALNQKRNMKLNDWFDEARKDVFIEIDPEFNYCDILSN